MKVLERKPDALPPPTRMHWPIAGVHWTLSTLNFQPQDSFFRRFSLMACSWLSLLTAQVSSVSLHLNGEFLVAFAPPELGVQNRKHADGELS